MREDPKAGAYDWLEALGRPITYVATDTTGNTASATFTATVLDLEDPIISGMPTDITMTIEPVEDYSAN